MEYPFRILEPIQKVCLDYIHWYLNYYLGFIIKVVPFVFAYMQEMQSEMVKMMESILLINFSAIWK